jgi:FkbM family methyltransferase
MSPETIARLVRSVRTIGVRNTSMLYRERESGLATLRLSFLKHPLFVRRTRTDRHVFQQVFDRRDYDIPALSELKPRVIVDAGAHAGFTSVFFANMFSGAVIHSIEPHPGNFELLSRNAKPYPNIKPLNAALWFQQGSVSLANPDADSSAFQFHAGSSVNAVTVDDVVPDGSIDILKMDVEGAERGIFEQRPAWLSRVRALLIETHDQFLPGCSQAVFDALGLYRYDRVIRGDVDLVLFGATER